MSDSPQTEASLHKFWIVPSDPKDLEPLPALVTDVRGLPDGALFPFDRKKREFNTNDPHDSRLIELYSTFEECRHAMMAQWLDDLQDATFNARHAAGVVEHLRTIPTQSFPNVLREVSETQVTQEEKAQEKIETSKPKVTTEPVKHSPTKGKSNA